MKIVSHSLSFAGTSVGTFSVGRNTLPTRHVAGAALSRWAAWLLVLVALSGATCSREQSELQIIFVGDIMLADGPGREIAKGVDPFAEFADLFHAADLTVGNLECVIATTGERVEKPYNFRANPRCIPLLKRYFQAVEVANNHTGDFGKGAFVEQLDRLSEGQIPHFGGGRNRAEEPTRR